jgi:hypothetical protein
VSAATRHGHVTWNPAATGTVRALAVTCDRATWAASSPRSGPDPESPASVNLVTGQSLAFRSQRERPGVHAAAQPGIMSRWRVPAPWASPRAIGWRRWIRRRGCGAAVEPEPNGTVRTIVADANRRLRRRLVVLDGRLPSGNLAALTRSRPACRAPRSRSTAPRAAAGRDRHAVLDLDRSPRAAPRPTASR